MVNKKAQVWIETVVYTLIAFVILGAVLAFAKPKIQELQDKAILEDSIDMLNQIDDVVKMVEVTEGNKREIEIGIKRGELLLNQDKDSLIFNLRTRYLYSEPGTKYKKGEFNVLTTPLAGKEYSVAITREYNSTIYSLSGFKRLGASSSSYNLLISNEGLDTDGAMQIKMELI